MHELPPIGLYIHIPWCSKKCPYCDFNSHTYGNTLPEQHYLEQLLVDLNKDQHYLFGRTVNTLFIGGGTPSLLTAQGIQWLLGEIKNHIPLASQAEITLEANPGSVDSTRFIGYQAAGINRLSIGVQSFHAASLHYLGRIHTPMEAQQAVQLAMGLDIRSVNIDLMHGLPHQSNAQAHQDLLYAIELAPHHLSWYQLTIEPYTAFASQPPTLPDDDQLWQIFQQGEQLLQHAGYQQYEISAYAKKGHICQHNLNYWRFGDYLGIGCGAHGKITCPDGNIIRTKKKRHPRGYLQGNHLEQQQVVPLHHRPLEFFMNRWRLIEPTPRQAFPQLTGVKEQSIRPILDHFIKAGYLEESSEQWQLTQPGRLLLNTLLEKFISE